MTVLSNFSLKGCWLFLSQDGGDYQILCENNNKIFKPLLILSLWNWRAILKTIQLNAGNFIYVKITAIKKLEQAYFKFGLLWLRLSSSPFV